MNLLLVLALAACGNQSLTSTDGALSSGADGQPSEERPSENQEDAVKKVLVVYYSATGSTKKAAEAIASAADGDLFALEPAEPYSAGDLDWTDETSRVVREHENPEERNVPLVTESAAGWEEYDVVFIGYPIWWGIAAWPVNGFIEANDFTGKTVIPFCTSSSSGLGQSGALLKEAAGTGDWLDGVRFSSDASEAEIRQWVESLDY